MKLTAQLSIVTITMLLLGCQPAGEPTAQLEVEESTASHSDPVNEQDANPHDQTSVTDQSAKGSNTSAEPSDHSNDNVKRQTHTNQKLIDDPPPVNQETTNQDADLDAEALKLIAEEEEFFRYVDDSELPPVSIQWTRLDEEMEIWVDMENHHVIVGGEFCLRRGPLEMFASTAGIKDHESVVAVRCRADLVHAGLLAVGAEPGSPVVYDPEYKAAHGTTVKIDATWMVDGKPFTTDARNLVKNLETGKPLQTDWVFGGSVEHVHHRTGEVLYAGNAGMMICVSNFTIATLDLPIESSALEDCWLFNAYSENIPHRGTRVLLTLKPVLEDE